MALLLLLTPLLVTVSGFLPQHELLSTSTRSVLGSNRRFLSEAANNGGDNSHIIVIGKIILDKYGDPQNKNSDDMAVTIGGGGPQAAWGACAALAVREMMSTSSRNSRNWEPVPVGKNREAAGTPPKQRVTFLAPVGLKNWTPEHRDSLHSLLPMLRAPPVLVTSPGHITPTINIWHNENEVVNWLPVNGSFGKEGADGLWRDRPCARDIIDAINEYDDGDEDIILHAILEAGHNSAGQGLDALPFFDPSLMDQVSVASIEPIVFSNEETGVVSNKDIKKVRSLITRLEASLSGSCKANNGNKLLLISPDCPCYDALFSKTDSSPNNMFNCDGEIRIEFAVRNGAKGSFINKNESTIIPSATLKTLDGTPVNPTGAGNAYSGAYAACRASGSSAEEAGMLANAVGAVVCEYDNLPPWTWTVLERVAEAACEVSHKVWSLRLPAKTT